jgi:ATP phosphoribosyltransferase regulatory subunit
MSHKSLLPSGCYDVLPKEAGAEAQLVSVLTRSFEDFGYQLVAPPLLEYTDNLLAGRGADLSPHILRVMDPETNRVMGVRADMTLQVARIVKTRLRSSPRPLRLSYAGSVLRLKGNSLEESRQLRQVGLELVGAGVGAGTEAIFVALRALKNAGIQNVTVDLHLPPLVGALLGGEATPQVMDAIAEKDSAKLKKLGLTHGALLTQLMEIAGDAKSALARIKALPLPPHTADMLLELEQVVSALSASNQGANITLDITERRGFDYYSGISFSFFASGSAQELGRGGRYTIGEETAVGCSFFAERLRELLPERQDRPVKVIASLDESEISKAIAEGYTVILGEKK